MWESVDKLFAHADEVFKEFEHSRRPENLANGWRYTVTRTWTTNSTAEPRIIPSYSDGFADGWNACEASAGKKK